MAPRSLRQCLIGLAALLIAASVIAASTHAQVPAYPSHELSALGAARPLLRFERLGVEDGLTQATVNTIMQDRQGFLWMGTLGGLHRFDGHTFEVYAPTPYDTTSLAGTFVWGVSETNNGDLLVATRQGGLHRMDRSTGTFTRYRHDPADSTTISATPPFYALEAHHGDLWVATVGGGLSRMRADADGRFTHYRHNPDDEASLTHDVLFWMNEGPDGHIWAGSANGLNRIDPVTETITRFLYDPTFSDLEHSGGYGAPQNVFDQYFPEDEPGVAWLATGDGLVRLNSETGDYERFRIVENTSGPDPRNFLHQVIPDPTLPGVLWVAGRGAGVARFDARTGRFTPYYHDPADPTSLGSDDAWSILADRSGTIWVGTSDAGLSSFNPQAVNFRHLRHDPSDAESLAPGSIAGLYLDRAGRLWASASVGFSDFTLTELDLTTGRVVRHRNDPGNPASLPVGIYFGFADDDQGTLWLGGPGVGMNRLDPATGRVTRFMQPDTPENQGRNNVMAVLPTAADPSVLWVGSVGGLDRLDTRTGTFTRFPTDDAGEGLLVRVLALAHDAAGTLWVGTRQGLVRVDPAGDVTLASAYDPTDPTTISEDIRSIAERAAEPGILWVATYGGGLHRFDTRTGQATRYSEADGLPSTFVLSILEDERGTLWMSTNRGISNLDPATGTFRTYGLDDGLMTLEYSSRAYTKGADGALFFGSRAGVTAFLPSQIQTNSVPPQVALTGLRLFNDPVAIGPDSPLERPLSETASFTLRHDQNEVAFDFVALHFANPDQNQYAYRLEGYDDRWVTAGTRRSATYTNLPPGTYTFRVKAANADGVWNDEGASVGMRITPPWWKTWWATLGYVLLAVSLLTAAYRARRSRHELRHRLELEHLEAEQLRELDQARSRFFANVSHEFRTPLTLTLGPLDDLQAGLYGPLPTPMAAQVSLARRNARRVLALINQMLDIARLEAGKTPLRAQPLDLAAFVDAVARPFREAAARKALTFAVDVPDAPVEVYLDPAQFEHVVANLLSNAVKFTPEGGAVRIAVAADAEMACVTVRDSGPGIPATDLPYVFDRFHQVRGTTQQILGTGIGLALAKEVVDLHGGAIAVASEQGFGSTFTVTFPLGHAHLAPDQVADEAMPWDAQLSAPPVAASALSDEETELDADAFDAPSLNTGSPPSDPDRTTVLVVEDHAEVRAYVRRHLEASPTGPTYRVLEASDGHAGLALARKHLPDLVLSDVMMPGLDGFALCRALKADPATDFIPVVLLTAKAAPEDKLEGLGELADDYLTKPFDPTELRARIANLIAVRTRLRARVREDGFFSNDGAATRALPWLTVPEAVTPMDEAFLERVRTALDAHLADETFSVTRLAEEVGMSRGHLHRQLKALAGQTPSELIRTVRLERAAHLLRAEAGTVSEIAYAVGFKSVSHFSDSFLATYGCRPSDYAAQREG